MNVEVNKKDFYGTKKAIPLKLINVNNIVISYKVKQNNDTCKYYIGYSDDDMIRPLHVVLPQVSGYIKYFENGGKSMSFKIESEDVYLKYNEIWNIIKSLLNIKLHSQHIYDEKYIKIKVKIFSNPIHTWFPGNKTPKERIHHVFIPAISIDSVLRANKRKYPQVYLEQCKYKVKKRELMNVIDDEVILSENSSDELDNHR